MSEFGYTTANAIYASRMETQLGTKKTVTMPATDTELWVSAASAGSQIGGQLANAGYQNKMNRQTRAWNERMWQYNRDAALADWRMTNEYNHPSNQMARLREAGLNPNLVYGEGSVANASSTPRSSDGGSWNPTAPKFDFSGAVSGGLGAIYDTQLKQAQIDNLKAQNTVIVQDAALRGAQIAATQAATGKTLQDTERSKFDLGLSQDLRDTSIDVAKQSLEKLKADTQFTLDSNERATIDQEKNLAVAMEQILKSRAERSMIPTQIQEIKARIDNLKKDGKLKDFEIKLAENGIFKGDPFYYRAVSTMLDALSNKAGKAVDTLFGKGTSSWMRHLPWPVGNIFK